MEKNYSMNKILELIKQYPTGGGYTWNPQKPSSGVTQDLIYKGETILKKDTATYCCGLTFQTWFTAYGQHLDIAVSEMKKVQRLWYCATGLRGGCADALMSIGQTELIADMPATALTHITEIEPGDFLQLWRKSGSGHSVVYLSHDAKTLTYWSTQPKTNGIGERTEKLADMSELYFVRPKDVEVRDEDKL